MDSTIVFISSAALGAVGLSAAAILAAAAKIFKVTVDPRIAEINEILPGVNCGGCGCAGCAAFAEELVRGKPKPADCTAASPEVLDQVAQLLGVEVGSVEKRVARLFCQGGAEICQPLARYQGIATCGGVAAVNQAGSRACPLACEGLGDCAAACPFGAVSIGADGLPRIDEQLCTACGACLAACPKGLLRIEPAVAKVWIACSTSLSAKQLKGACPRGCRDCSVCVKACPYEALLPVEGTFPQRDPQRCTNCGLCLEACRFGAIRLAPGFQPDLQARAAAEQLAAERQAARRVAKTKRAVAKSRPTTENE